MPATDPDRTSYLNWVESERAEYERRLPEMNEQRLKSLESAKQMLVKLDSNVDVYKSLRDHLTRLGWRTENAQDRARAEQEWMKRVVAVLQDIRELEKRPEGNLGEWAEAMRRRQGVLSGALRLVRKDDLDRGSPDGREVRMGGVERRLLSLASTGRITKDDYDDLEKRLQRH